MDFNNKNEPDKTGYFDRFGATQLATVHTIKSQLTIAECSIL